MRGRVRARGWSEIKAAVPGAGLTRAFFGGTKNVRLREGKPFARGHAAERSEKRAWLTRHRGLISGLDS